VPNEISEVLNEKSGTTRNQNSNEMSTEKSIEDVASEKENVPNSSITDKRQIELRITPTCACFVAMNFSFVGSKIKLDIDAAMMLSLTLTMDPEP